MTKKEKSLKEHLKILAEEDPDKPQKVKYIKTIVAYCKRTPSVEKEGDKEKDKVEGSLTDAEVLENMNKGTLSLSERTPALDDDIMDGISYHLSLHTTVQKIDLSGNTVGDKGGEFLSRALKVNTTLTDLSLSKNKLGNPGATKIAEGIKESKSLTKLDLSGNEIKLEGAKEIANSIEKNTVIKVVNMKTEIDLSKFRDNVTQEIKYWDQDIDDNDAAVLAKVLKPNTTLTRLDLRSNVITDDGAKLIEEALKDNNTLKEVYLQLGNYWTL